MVNILHSDSLLFILFFSRSEEPVNSNMDISTGHIVLVIKEILLFSLTQNNVCVFFKEYFC